jgi:hypothetical protein
MDDRLAANLKYARLADLSARWERCLAMAEKGNRSLIQLLRTILADEAAAVDDEAPQRFDDLRSECGARERRATLKVPPRGEESAEKAGMFTDRGEGDVACVVARARPGVRGSLLGREVLRGSSCAEER